MKKTLVIGFFFCTFAVLGQVQELKLTADSWPPFTDTKGNKSILTVLVQEALYRRNINSSVEIEDFAKILDLIEKGDYDGSPALWKSPERELKFLYSDPYLYNQLILVGRKGSDVDAESFEELKGKKIGIVEYFDYGAFEGKEGVDWIPGKSNQDNLEKLLSEKIDYMLVDALIIQYMLKYQLNDVTTYLAIGLKPLLVKPLHLALRKDLENADLILTQFNEEIDEMIEDGTFNEILELNWVRADIDGDGRMELVLGGQAAGTSAPQNIYGLMMDNSYKTDNGPRRYYIDGKLYEDWDDIPKSYKLDLIEDRTPSEEDVKVKLKF
mgnify:CR=1 FL=1